MRLLTLSAMTLLLSMSGNAQNAFSLNSPMTQSPISSKVEYSKSQRKMLGGNNAVVNAESAANMKPQHEEEWIYEEEWIKSGDYYYSHDKRGNIVKNTYSDEYGSTMTEYAYDEYNNVVSQIESYSEGEDPFENSSKRILVYDPIVKNVIIDSQSYMWNETDWLLYSDGHTYKRVITRNDNGNITNVEVYSYFIDEYHLQHRSTITYNSENVAETWKYEELGYTSTGDLTMNEIYTLTDMQWHVTDGQILALNDLTDFFTSDNNKLKKATVYSKGTLTGSIEASYQDNGDYTYKYSYTTSPCAEETYTHTVTDAFGSYIETTVAYEDMNEDNILTEDELAMSEQLVVNKNEYGKVIEEVATADDEMVFSAKYEYTYSDEYGSYPIEQIHYEYDAEEADYIPYIKIVATDFYDVAGIGETFVDTTFGSKSVYNMQGIKVGTDINEMPAGLYIVNQNGKVSKIIKR